MNKYTINDITRASGGFAMLAVDQREAMRMMFAAAGAPAPVADSVLTDFKVNAAKALSPYASAILVDQQFCYRQVVEQNAIAKSCAMIVAADEFIPGNGIPVDSVVIDRKINPLQIKQDGGKALKLLVLWRSDEDAQQRLDMVKEFNELCHSHGLVSIIEPVVRPPRRGDKFDREQAIIDAAKELGADIVIGSDVCIHKAEPAEPSQRLIDILYRATDLLEYQANKHQLSQADVLISPQVGFIDQFEVEKSAQCAEIGYETTLAKMDQIKECIYGRVDSEAV